MYYFKNKAEMFCRQQFFLKVGIGFSFMQMSLISRRMYMFSIIMLLQNFGLTL